MRTPFATLLHFEKPAVTGQPRVLVVGPMSGHFTTLIRPTIRTLLSDHDVHVLDWHNARDIPVERRVRSGWTSTSSTSCRRSATSARTPTSSPSASPPCPVLAAVALLAADG